MENVTPTHLSRTFYMLSSSIVSMILDVPAVMLAGLAISSFFIPGTETAPCPLATVAMNITSSADVNHLADLLDCAGKGKQ